MQRPDESGELTQNQPETIIIEELLNRIQAAPADASIQSLAAEVGATHLNAPIDLLSLSIALKGPVVRTRLRKMLQTVIGVHLDRFNTQKLAAETMEVPPLVPRDSQFAARRETALDCVYRNMYAVRHGVTVSDVLRQVLYETETPVEELVRLFSTPEVLTALTSSLLIAAYEKISQQFIDRFAGTQKSAELISFARNGGQEDSGRSLQLLLAYGISFGDSLRLMSNRGKESMSPDELLKNLRKDRDSTKVHLKAEILDWFEHVGSAVSMQSIVRHFAQEAFQYYGLGVDEVVRLLTSPEVEELLNEHVIELAESILGSDFASELPVEPSPLDVEVHEGIAKGKTTVAQFFAKSKQQNGSLASTHLPNVPLYTEALKAAAEFEARKLYGYIVDDESRKKAPEDCPVISNLGLLIAEHIAQGAPPAQSLFAAVDDLERCKISFDDACKIVAQAMTLAGYSGYKTQRVQSLFYTVLNRFHLEEASRVQLPIEKQGVSHEHRATTPTGELDSL